MKNDRSVDKRDISTGKLFLIRILFFLVRPVFSPVMYFGAFLLWVIINIFDLSLIQIVGLATVICILQSILRNCLFNIVSKVETTQHDRQKN